MNPVARPRRAAHGMVEYGYMLTRVVPMSIQIRFRGVQTILLVVSFGWVMGFSSWLVGAADSRPATSQPAGPSASEVREAIADLSNPRPARRRAAARQLASWGPAVIPDLRRVAAEADLETALLARALLSDLEQALFSGAQIRLRAEPSKARWNEAVRLVVEVHNPSAAPIRVPWPAVSPAAATRPTVGDAEQVGAMLDIADYLGVLGPDGQEVSSRCELIDRDPEVSRAVHARAAGAITGHKLAPGGTVVLTIPAFNRGWMRYPLLAAGRYTIQLKYQPSWREKEWERQGLGLVQSPPLAVEITESAPESVRCSSIELSMTINLRQEIFEAVLTNTWDRLLWINLNIGEEWPTHAKLQWLWQPVGGDAEQMVRLNLDETGAEFAVARVRPLESGQSMVLSRLRLDQLREKIGQQPALSGQLTVRYINPAGGAKTGEMLSESGQKVELPTHLLSGSAQSEPVFIHERKE